MLSFFRRVSNSKVGTGIMALMLIGILAGFAIADVSNFGSGNIGFGGMSQSTLASVGGREVAERDLENQMQRRLQQARQENPDANYASIMGDFDGMLGALIDDASGLAFADKYGFPLSKRLIDGTIAQLPQAKGLNGQFSEQAYQAFLQRERLTDKQVRQIISGGLLQRLMVTPIAANARVPVGVATPYASMLLETREGEGVAVPIDVFKRGLQPTDAALQQYYSANRARYAVPEQRVVRLATVGPAQVGNVAASPQEIAAYYNANRANYAANDTRSLSQVVVPDRGTANAIATRAKAGGTLAAAAAPAGTNAAVTTLQDQTRQAYSSVAGQVVAGAAFSAPSGAVIGPLQSDFGWVVVKVDGVKSTGGKTLEQATPEIAEKLNADKRKAAIEDIVDRLQTAIDDGSNFAEAAAAAKLSVTTTPLITANGTSRTDVAYKLPPELAPAIKPAFEIAANDPPEVVALGDQGYVMVSPAEVVPAAPAPLASIRERVAADWTAAEALKRAKATADAIAAKAAGGASLAEAAKQSGAALPAPMPLGARRIQLMNAQGQVPPPLRVLFSVPNGKARAVPVPGGKGFYVVKVNKVVPGNAMLQPALIGKVRGDLQQSVSEDYGRQFQAAVRAEMKVKRNESAIAATKSRLASASN